MPYQALADAVLLFHLGVVVFNVAGLVATVVGNFRGWAWVNHPWFRLLHLAAIAVVVAQAWLGQICPLTTFETWLRRRAGAPSYDGSFIEHWVQRVLFFDLPAWVFTLSYTAFGMLVAVAWWYFPPRRLVR